MSELHLTLFDVIAFLFGDADSIVRVASSRHNLLVGAMLVLSAALARNWQRHDLSVQPWLLLIPFAASLVSSTALTVLLALWWPDFRPQMLEWLPRMAGLFWMTAPLAWIYGIPFEALVERKSAARARLTALTIVSLWRVALVVRCLCVLLDIHVASAMHLVIFFGIVVAIAAIHFTRRRDRPQNIPMIAMGMAGISSTSSRSPEARVVANFTGCLSALLWIGLVPSIGLTWTSVRPEPPLQIHAGDAVRAASPGVWGASACAIGFWLMILPAAQRKQRSKTRVSNLIESGRYLDAVTFLSETDADSFPVSWVPPVETALDGWHPERLMGMMNLMPEQRGRWFAAGFETVFVEYLKQPLLYWFSDVRSAEVAELLPSVVGIRPEDATEILQQLSDMKEWLDVVGGQTERNSGRPTYESTSENKVECYVDQDGFIISWPPETNARRVIREELERRTAV
ncbi:MAG: hypothetical protein R3C20_08070 [Planctomycetaceae bacterium]